MLVEVIHLMIHREDLDDSYFKALDLEKNGDLAGAFSLFMQGASLGDDGAQNAVGLSYDTGSGVEKDKDKAIAWFKKAWRTSKYTGYCLNVALTYAEIGRRRRAMYWWHKAIAKGDGSAALSLAKFLLESNRHQTSNRILGLLKMAAECQEPWQISPDEREEAQKLLEDLISKNS